MLKKINVEDAVGTRLAHDITEIRPGAFKGPAFRKGHEVCNEDICHLQKLGKNHLYLIDLEPDDEALIVAAIQAHLNNGCDLLLLSGGMSVDPDDITRKAIRNAGASEVYYGAAALPGAMFLSARIGDIPLLGVPACGLHHKMTVLDLVLPRILAGETIGKKELAFIGHGGLCKDCPECSYPHCPFGKGM
jgi:molybdopterin biosynthesis enzyme